MPTISHFYGISIRMYSRDHAPPHFHAVYGEHEACVAIASGDVIMGSLPARARRLVREWCQLHREVITKNWQLGSSGEQMERIPGLDVD